MPTPAEIPPPPAIELPTENLDPKARTAPTPKAPSTLEGHPLLPTDELGLRGTGRQPLAKTTSEEVAPKMELRTTVVDAKPYKEPGPTQPEPTASARQATTVIEEAPKLPIPPPAPPPTPFVPPPILKAPAASTEKTAGQAPHEVEYLTPSTVEMQSALANKPFFTRMISPQDNRQHKHLVYAVPLVLLTALLIFIAFWWLR